MRPFRVKAILGGRMGTAQNYRMNFTPKHGWQEEYLVLWIGDKNPRWVMAVWLEKVKR